MVRRASPSERLWKRLAPTPRLPESASIRFVSTLSVSTTVGFWNFRPIPSRAQSASSSRVRSVSSSQTTRPSSGRVLPVMMSSIVVFPAPFGPTTARSSPLAIAIESPLIALKPSKLRCTSCR